ncbi:MULTISPECIES: hypothetical protein [Actinosynnema]|uniref:hypothetical protein n=1 Tax=Actinosynnema TaxID=40566 RepID=UPI0020A4C40B|nr:hypothetical protein [Actinosynnema pretiosum]MCP2099452.1 hypothetical protein [Actinosynnema pretiosum]
MVARVFSAGHRWRLVLIVVGAALAVLPWDGPPVGLFGVVPLLLWCGSWTGTRRVGVVVALVLLGLLVWFVVAPGLGFSGRWAPSTAEVLWLHPLLAGAVCAVGARAGRLPVHGWRLTGVAALGFLLLGFLGLTGLEAPPGDEGVAPALAVLRVEEGEPLCGSGGCARQARATGDRAPEVARERLAARGFAHREPLDADDRLCRATGLVVEHEVCAELRDVAPDAVRVVWYAN